MNHRRNTFDIWHDMSTGNSIAHAQASIFIILNPNRVGIEHTMGESQNAYLAATTVKQPPTIREEPTVQPVPGAALSDTDSDSN